MGNITALSLIERAGTIIQDETNIRWPQDELLKWLNDGQREIVLHKPSSYPQDGTKSLVAGTKQTIPTDGIALIDIPRNEVGKKRAIRIVEREILDAQRPEWHDETPSQEVRHYVFDNRNPKHFFVYPPNNGSGEVNVIYSAAPVDIGIGDTITIDDIYANALLDYIIYRASTKDADYALNDRRAEAMYRTFLNSLGVLDQRQKIEEPNVVTKSSISERYTG